MGRVGQGGRRWWPAIAAVLAILAVSAAWLAQGRAFRAEPLPNPNGYDDLAAAGAMVTGQPPAQGDSARATVEELRAWVGPNRPALARAKVGLRRDSRVPLPATPEDPRHFDHLGRLRQLARLLTGEAALADQEGRAAEAAEAHADAPRLAPPGAFGGPIRDKPLGRALGGPGVDGLARLAPALSADDGRRPAREVERLDRRHEPAERVVARDRAFT